MKNKLIRITTVPQSLKILLKGQHHFMSQNGLEVIGISSKGKELEDVAKDENIEVVPLEMSREITPIKDFISLWKMYRLLKIYKPKIVHTHTPKAGIIGMLAAKMARVPHRLHTVAGMPLMETKGVKRRILNFVERLTYWSSSKVYPNSNRLYDFIVIEGLAKKEKLKVIANGSSNGIDTDYFNPELFSELKKNKLREQLNIKKEDFVFVFVGRLVRDKGINELVSAFKAIKHPSTKLLLVGSEERNLDPLNQETIDEIESNSNIIAVGFQQDVRPYFAVADCLAFPSYREGFPNVVMQAGAMELPSIVSDINGCNEIIQEAENGLIIPPKNQRQLKLAMERVLGDDQFTKKLRESSRSTIVERYQQKVIWDALLEEYNTLLYAIE